MQGVLAPMHFRSYVRYSAATVLGAVSIIFSCHAGPPVEEILSTGAEAVLPNTP